MISSPGSVDVPERIVVALGGHALIHPGQRGTIEEQRAALRESLGAVVHLARMGMRLLVTHGNGPQVGHILTRSEQSRGHSYELPLDVCVAQSQGETGYLIQQTLQNFFLRERIDRLAVSLITQAVVDPADPDEWRPRKPIGPHLTPEGALALVDRGWHIAPEPGRGPRRLVPSPPPLRVVEVQAIRQLVDAGTVVVAAGGGGIPAITREDGTLEGAEAVVDKDLTSSLLATALGAHRILDLTLEPGVKLHYGSAGERLLESMTVARAREYLAEGRFAEGSMKPKIEAAIRFLDRGGREVVITSPERAIGALLEGRGGTRIVPGGA